MDGSGVSASVRRIAGWVGIVFAVVFTFSFFLVDPSPATTDSAETIREFFAEDDANVQAFTLLTAFLVMFGFVPFALVLRMVLDSGDEQAELSARLSWGGAVVAAAIGGAGSVFWSGMALGKTDELSDGALRAAVHLDAVVYQGAFSWALALFLAAAGWAIVRSGALPRWLGALAGLAAVVLVVGTFWVFDGDNESALSILGIVGFNLWFLWTLLTGVMLVRSARSE